MARVARRDLKLEECGLYALISPKFLACRLSVPKYTVTPDDIAALANNAENYNLFVKNSKDGRKPRPIQEPKRKLQAIHARIHKLLSRVTVPPYLHSAVKGRSYLSNASAHARDVPVIKIDVKKFFPSVPRVAVYRFFHESLRCRRDVAGLLADLLTFNARLPTGSSASPIIAFYAFKPMFDAVDALAKAHNLTMTCYVDDMVLSGPGATKGVLFEVRKIIAQFGLKSHKAHAFGPSEPKVVTGVCVAVEGQRVPNRLHLKIKNGFDALAATTAPDARTKILRPLLGRLEAAAQIDPAFKAKAVTLRSSMQTR